MTQSQHGRTLVLAGTGKTGRRVVARLVSRELPVRIGSRSGTPPFDWHDPTTWERALYGVRSVYVAYHPDAGFPGAAQAVGSFSDLAVRCGVRRLVLLADRGASEAERCEQVVRTSGAEWTIVRTGFISQNFSEDVLTEAIKAGVVALPAGDAAEPFTDAENIADVAAAALIEEGHTGETYEVTGPRLLTFTDAVAEIARQTGRTIRYVPVSKEQFATTLTEHGTPERFAGQLADLMAEVFDGRRAHLADGVYRALGRGPKDFTDYVHDAARTGVWLVTGPPSGSGPAGRGSS
ncbi:NmrA family transcriptional regulator [Nonomuraea deserti]|uniref:NmrA family transcriptional regulator n=2 Tax=Nonomuraea deserti TaxID=1848322 RepID=A0A4R4UNF1_9ACTN|nr:NmrA family transcriptional regulator [Nonomuraea deserti]